jgi:hypothetical protein
MARITPRPYGSSTVPTSVKVKQVIRNGNGDITGLVYTITGGQPPQIGMSSDEKKLSSVNVLNGAPLYLPPGIDTAPISSFYGPTKNNAFEYYGTNLFFTTADSTKKQIAYTDTANYSGSLFRSITLDKRFFDTTISLSDTTASNTSTDISWNNSSNTRIILRKATSLSTNNYGDIVNPYSAKSPMLVLATSSAVFQITKVEPNYYDNNISRNGYIKYYFSSDSILSFGGYNTFFNDAAVIANTINSPTIPITIAGIDASAYNLANVIPTQIYINTDVGTGSSGYFLIKIEPYATNNTALPSNTYPNGGTNPDTGRLDPLVISGATGRIAPANIVQKRVPTFRRLNGDDIDLTLNPTISSVQNLLVTDGEKTIKKFNVAPGNSVSEQRQYFLRGDNTWAVPPSSGIFGQIDENRTLISAADPINPSTDTRTFYIQATYNSSYSGNLNILATGAGILTLTGGSGGLTLLGGNTNANATGVNTSISGVTNSGNGLNSKGGPLYLDGGSGGQDATSGDLFVGTLSSNIILGANGNTTTINGKISTSSTGILEFTSKGSSTPSAPGASKAVIYVKDSTTYSGKLRLCIRAGSGAETTILDNISI